MGACLSAELDQECYNSKGADYRGLANATVSGVQCLAWNSDLLYNEIHVGTVDAPPASGLGDHAFCRCGDRRLVPPPPTSRPKNRASSLMCNHIIIKAS